jgi:hypothetical protein
MLCLWGQEKHEARFVDSALWEWRESGVFKQIWHSQFLESDTLLTTMEVRREEANQIACSSRE